MKIPSEIKIGAVTWRIEIVDGYVMDCDRPPSGDTSILRGIIRLNKDLPSDLMEQTFFHELLHAINIEMDHEKVEMMATLLHQALKPSLV